MSQVTSGVCLCGAVKVSLTLANKTFDACHCGMCRTWGGGPTLTVQGGTDIKFAGDEFVTRYNSSEWAERGFCMRCGTHLFYRLKETEFYEFSFGLLKDTADFKFHQQIFIDMKPENYSFANKTETVTQAEIVFKYPVNPLHKEFITDLDLDQAMAFYNQLFDRKPED